MSEEFLCQVCQSAFTSEAEAAAHMMSAHVTRFAGKPTSASVILDALREAFPEAECSVQEGSGWHAHYILKVRQEGTLVHQYLGNCDPHGHRANPESVEDAVTDIRRKFYTAAQITERARKIGLADFTCTGFAYGYARDEHAFRFTFTADGKQHEVSWAPEGNESIQRFLLRLRTYTVRKAEGAVKEETDRYFVSYVTVAGIPAEEFLRRARRARIELLD